MDSGWYTLAEAGRQLGLSRGALCKRIARGRLEARKGNDGRVQVLVTSETESGRSQDGQGDGVDSVHLNGISVSTSPDAIFLVQVARLEERLAASTRRESDLQALVVDLRRDREALQATIDRLAAELVEARKGWLERLIEAVRRK